MNVVGAFQMIRAARVLLEAAPQPGAVVNTASIAGVIGIGSSVPYAASKGALITMTLSLARALAPKIRVNAICPGFIDTPWFGRAMPAEALERLRQGVAASTPLKVASTAEDIAGGSGLPGLAGGAPHHRRNPDGRRRHAPRLRAAGHALRRIRPSPFIPAFSR